MQSLGTGSTLWILNVHVVLHTALNAVIIQSCSRTCAEMRPVHWVTYIFTYMCDVLWLFAAKGVVVH